MTRLIIAEYEGVAKLDNIELEVNAREQLDELTGVSSVIITERKQRGTAKKSMPQMRFLDEKGDSVNKHGTDTPVAIALPPGATLMVRDNEAVKIGDIIAKMPQVAGKAVTLPAACRVSRNYLKRANLNYPRFWPKPRGGLSLRGMRRNKQILVIVDEKGREHEHHISKERSILVQDGSLTNKGEAIVDGDANPHEILSMRGIEALVAYIVNEVQDVYRLQGVNINDKHIEVIVHQMLRCVQVTDAGQSQFILGDQVLLSSVMEENAMLAEQEKKPANTSRFCLALRKHLWPLIHLFQLPLSKKRRAY